MAEESTDTEYLPPAIDYRAHESTYRNFINLMKWSTGALAVMLVVLYFLINP